MDYKTTSKLEINTLIDLGEYNDTWELGLWIVCNRWVKEEDSFDNYISSGIRLELDSTHSCHRPLGLVHLCVSL